MASQVMRITLKAYDHQLVDASAKKIIETVKKNGSKVSEHCTTSDKEGSSYNLKSCSQIQRFQRTVRTENS